MPLISPQTTFLFLKNDRLNCGGIHNYYYTKLFYKTCNPISPIWCGMMSKYHAASLHRCKWSCRPFFLQIVKKKKDSQRRHSSRLVVVRWRFCHLSISPNRLPEFGTDWLFVHYSQYWVVTAGVLSDRCSLPDLPLLPSRGYPERYCPWRLVSDTHCFLHSMPPTLLVLRLVPRKRRAR